MISYTSRPAYLVCLFQLLSEHLCQAGGVSQPVGQRFHIKCCQRALPLPIVQVFFVIVGGVGASVLCYTSKQAASLLLWPPWLAGCTCCPLTASQGLRASAQGQWVGAELHGWWPALGLFEIGAAPGTCCAKGVEL